MTWSRKAAKTDTADHAPAHPCAKVAISADSELAFTTQCIQRNFSNYSAWHYRTLVLADVYVPDSPSSCLAISVVSTELRLVREAVFTEPDDQSPWLYRRWLLGHLEAMLGQHRGIPDATTAELEVAVEKNATMLLQEDLASLRELVSVATTSKCEYHLCLSSLAIVVLLVL